MHPVGLVCLPSCSSVVDRLHFVPCCSVNNRLVRIFSDDLFALRYVQHFVVFIGKACRAVLGERADIRSVFENIRNGLLRPVGRVLSVRLFSVQPRIVCRGIGDPFVGEFARDGSYGIALQTHIVNTADCFCRFLVNDCRAVFVRARFIAVGVFPVGVPARLPFGF